jgi:hypothetical protein
MCTVHGSRGGFKIRWISQKALDITVFQGGTTGVVIEICVKCLGVGLRSDLFSAPPAPGTLFYDIRQYARGNYYTILIHFNRVLLQ